MKKTNVQICAYIVEDPCLSILAQIEFPIYYLPYGIPKEKGRDSIYYYENSRFNGQCSRVGVISGTLVVRHLVLALKYMLALVGTEKVQLGTSVWNPTDTKHDCPYFPPFSPNGHHRYQKSVPNRTFSMPTSANMYKSKILHNQFEW